MLDTLIELYPNVLKWGVDLRQGIVHRLDKPTSGLILCAYEKDAYEKIKEKFASRTVIKKYYAYVENSVQSAKGMIDAPIGVDPKNKSRNKVVPNGRESITRYEVVRREENFDQLDIELVTGRKHQIRTHLAYLGNPILNDTLYGANNFSPLPSYAIALHCYTLEFQIDNKEYLYKSSIPKYLENLNN